MPDLESSSGSPIDDVQPSNVPDVNSVDSSPADGEPSSTLDAVRAALHPEESDEAAPASQTQGQQSATAPTQAPTAEQAPDELTPEDMAKLKGRTKKSFERLTSSNAELTKFKETVSKEVEALRGRAAEYDKVLDYIRQTKLSPEDLDSGIGIMALIKQGRPHEAYERLVPIVTQLQRIIGVDLPPDLKEQVRNGYLTDAHARELASARSAAHFSNAREQSSQKQQEEAQQVQATQRIVQEAANAATVWEQQKQTSDPDWNRKSARIQDLVKLEVYEKGYPRTGNAVVQMLEGIYKRVTDEVKAFQPRPSGIRPPVNGQASSRSVAEPKTMLEAIQQRLHAT